MSQGKRCKVIISDSPPEKEMIIREGEPPVEGGYAGVGLGFLWFNPSENKFYQMADLDAFTWEAVNLEGDFGDVNFMGKVKVDDKRGDTVNITIPNVGELKFKEGIMHKFTPV